MFLKFNTRTWMILAYLYVIYLAYGTLLPFNFSFSLRMLQTSLSNIELLERYGRILYTTKNIDAMVNLFIFMPLGIIIYNIRASQNKRNYLWSILLAMLAGLVLSGIIEIAQLLIKERRTSLVDMLMNTLGSLSGVILAFIFSRIISISNRQKIRTFFRKMPDVLLLLPLFLLGLFLPEQISSYFLKTDRVGSTIFDWQYIIQPVWIWQTLYIYIPIGILISRMVRKSLASTSLLKQHLMSFISAMVVFASLEILKLAIYKSPIPLIQIIYGIIGILIGIAISDVIKKNGLQKNHMSLNHNIYIISGIFFIIGSLILYKFAYPFDFNLDKNYVLGKLIFSLLSVHSFIPFNGFQKLLIFSLQSVALFLPIGMIVQELDLYLRIQNRRSLLFVISSIFILLIFLLQIINLHQIPFLFEVPTSLFGIFLGYFIWYGFRYWSPDNLKSSKNEEY